MIKKIITCLSILGTISLKAQIVYTDFNPDSTMTLNATIGGGAGISLDIDASGTEDYYFRWDHWGTDWFLHMGPSGTNELNLKGTATNPFGGRYIDPMTVNTNIGPTANWGTSFPEPFIGDNADPNFQDLGDRYVGIRFTSGGNIHFGWVRVSFDSTLQLTVKDYAYQSTPNTPILAGDSGGPTVLVNGITIQGQGGASTITTANGTLQMQAIVLPINATNNTVTWSVTNGTGSASISNTGLLTATTNGTVFVKATANDASGISDSTTITLSNQTTTTILVNDINVKGQGGASTITTPNGTLQMLATVLPANATNKDVDWEVTNNTGSATISNTGLLTAVADGTVSVKATAKDGSGTVDSTTITISNQTTTGISSSNLGYDITIYPNPTSDKLYIENETVTPLKSVKVIDITGKEIYKTIVNSTLNNPTIEVNLEKVNKGIYFLQLTDEQNNTIIQKIYIQ